MADEQWNPGYGEPGYFDPSSGATNPGDTAAAGARGDPYTSDYPSESLGLEDDPNASYDMPYSDDVDAGGGVMPGAETGSSILPGNSQLLPAFLNQYNNRYGQGPNLGVSPMPRGSPGFPGGVNTSSARAGGLVRYVRQQSGLRISARAIVALILKYGFAAAATLTKLGAADLLFLFMREKGVRHHRRGPGLYTVARKLRAAQRLQHTVARILGRGFRGGRHSYVRHRRAPPFHTMRRHPRRKR